MEIKQKREMGNIQQPTSNIEHPVFKPRKRVSHWMPARDLSELGVEC
jgi:hypothetical protein